MNSRAFATCSLMGLLTLVPKLVIAQNDSVSSRLAYPFWTFDFAVQANFTVGPFLGSAVSVSRFSDPDTKWRYGLGFSLAPTDYDEIQKYRPADTLYSQTQGTRKNSSYSFSLVAQHIDYLTSGSIIRCIGGWGPVINWSQSTTSLDQQQLGPSFATYRNGNEESYYSWAAGASILAGVEWQLSKQMALHATYGVQALYVRSRMTTNSWQSVGTDPRTSTESMSTGTGWKLQGSSVLFGVSVAM